MTTDSWTFCHRCARMIWMSEIFSVGICAQQPRLCQTRCTPYQPVPNSTETELPRHATSALCFAGCSCFHCCGPGTCHTLPCMKMPVRSSWTWKPTYTLARLIVGDHHSVKRRLGI